MKLPAYFSPLIFIALISFTTGCLSWESGWKTAQASSARGDVNAILVKAKKLAGEADSKEKVQQIIDTYEEALKIDPNNVTALKELGMYCFLMAYCYIDRAADKEPLYLKAIQYNERVMYDNPEFKALVDKGEPVWEACRVLKKDQMFAMYHWYLALGNCWTDCYSTLGKLVNSMWPGRDKKVLDRMTELDANWYSGSIHFCWAAYYTILPGFLGGDMKKAEDYYNKALAVGPHMINFYVTRAFYFHKKQNDRKGFVEDLHHALAIDPRQADSLEYAWAAWYHVRAVNLLKEVGKYFK